MDPIDHNDPHYNSKVAADCEERGEPCFTLRAQDVHASSAVREWAYAVGATGNDEMATRALKIAEEMDAWPTKKEPDL